MSHVAIPAHFDGLQIRLDKAVNIEPGDWTQLAMAGLENAYGENEPEYSLDLIIEANSDYERKKVIL
jgi:hypothetical protein